ncbi:MAG: 4Fe-4S binding protein [Nitrospirae bacterium]|nr:4Fe-4S binding protein [Nitrospirota bacterium]
MALTKALTLEDLSNIKEASLKKSRVKETPSDPENTERDSAVREDAQHTIHICGGPGCRARGSLKIKEALERELEGTATSLREVAGPQTEAESRAQASSIGDVSITLSGCNGFCNQGPVMTVDDVFYQSLKTGDVATVVGEHLVKGQPVERLMYKNEMEKTYIPGKPDIPFFALQKPRVLARRGLIDPDEIKEYLDFDGYQALAEVVAGKSAEDIISEIKASGLRGRGGGGFPAGIKWEICAREEARQKYIICNAGPVSRSIVENDPHSIIEGMAICAIATGATKGYIFVREPDSLLLIKRIRHTIEEAGSFGLIGNGILGKGYRFDLEISIGAGTFICGEETAMLSSIEGRRGFPSPKPPYPAVRGLWKKPTIVDNAETFANVPLIILNGAEWFRSVGTSKSPGTKIFTLTGEINTSGLIEVPMDITFKSVIDGIGGGMKKKKTFKALHIGGPTGGFIPGNMIWGPTDGTPAQADRPATQPDSTETQPDGIRATYEDITCAGATMGSGNLIVMDSNACMVNTAMFSMESASGESCGKCVPCRIGMKLMYEKLRKITEGYATASDLEVLEEMAGEVKRTSLCGFGQTAPLAVLTTLKYFRAEYEAHVNNKWCPAGKCKALSTFYIDEKVCTGCTSCARKCPQKAITGERKKPHAIDQSLCIQCRTCYETCTFGSIRIGPKAKDMFTPVHQQPMANKEDE